LSVLAGTDKTSQNPNQEVLAGFVGTVSGSFQKVRVEPSAQELAVAGTILSLAGVRLMRLEGGDAVGVWSDLDSPAIRNALRVLGSGELPILYLDGPRVLLRYKLRRAVGDPVPTSVREEMERSPEPWKVRNRMPCNFVPWPLSAGARPHAIDPETGIWPTAEWGSCCGRGFVSSARFGPNQLVIPRTNRAITRKWRSLNDRN
jgi:hypothetical protein